MLSLKTGFKWFAALLLTISFSGTSFAACQNTGNFQNWLTDFKKEAVAQGISQRTVSAALDGVSLDPNVIRSDRSQGVFSQTFLTFSDRMVSNYRLQNGAKHIKNMSSTFARIEREFGVPAPVIVAFWALETDFGANIGKLPVLRSLATLAYDCRRPERFRHELLSALRIVERGDLTPQQMVGPWAGEMGQTQFLASHYYTYGVDYDGDGRRDLLRSSPDALASAANLMANLGWRKGQPWLEEVRVPGQMPWEEADLDIQHTRAQWAKWGVKRISGQGLPNDNMKAALLLPMGRNGPAFLAYQNFHVYLGWNESLVYATTAA
ncbi:MAG: lytic murein transglycosylase, partial [Fimbriimonadaceae bacterium]|nr:lytic murein transglycosylase [Alphaproteobacteria bacterium]